MTKKKAPSQADESHIPGGPTEDIEPRQELQPEVPEFLRDEPPKTKTMYIKWGLMHGKTEEELVAEGSNSRSVDICAQELEKDGYRKRPPKPPKPTKDLVSTSVQAGAKDMQVFAKGSPPEVLINAISIPVEDGHIDGFEKGLKFGANIIVLGVRIAQELSNLGIQQARPIIDMAKSMREGEAMAAKGAAGEAAMTAAALVQQNLQPYLSAMSKPPVGPNPMQEMMARVMEPMMGRMLSMVIPGAGPQEAPGWTRKTE